MADPNVGRSFISDKMGNRALMSEISANCDFLKISIEDLDWISPKNQTCDKKA